MNDRTLARGKPRPGMIDQNPTTSAEQPPSLIHRGAEDQRDSYRRNNHNRTGGVSSCRSDVRFVGSIDSLSGFIHRGSNSSFPRSSETIRRRGETEAKRITGVDRSGMENKQRTAAERSSGSGVTDRPSFRQSATRISTAFIDRFP